MTSPAPLPAFRFRPDTASLWQMIREGVGDVGSVIPAAILDQPAVKLPGSGAPLVVADPDLARLVLNDRADSFTRDRYIRRLFRRSWGKGLAGAEGEPWQRQRRAVAPFFRPQAVTRHLKAFADAAQAVAAELPAGTEVEARRFASRIVARVVFSTLVEANGEVDFDAAADDVQPYITRLAGFRAFDLLPLGEHLIDRIAGIDRDPAVIRLRALAARIAGARGPAPRGDMIDLLMGEGPIEDNVRGLFPAAMDTTVNALAWALHTLALRPEWQAQLATEARACAGEYTLDRLPLTRRAVQEVLRLYAPAPLLARSPTHDQELGEHRLRRGQTVIVAIYALHRHHRHWHDPGEFDPDRFLPGKGVNPAYMPFGIGPRMCVAAQFAQAELTVILARLLTNWELTPTDRVPDVSLQITTWSRTGLHIVANCRS